MLELPLNVLVVADSGNILNLAYIDTDHKYPIEYSISHITGSKNHSNGLNKNQTYVNLGLRKYRGKLFFGFGLGLTSETNDRLSTAFNFKSELGYTYKHFVFKVAHISNADIKRPNHGENIVTIGYRKEL